MKTGKIAVKYSIMIILGITLIALGCMNTIDNFWSGMGGALIGVSLLRLIQFFRYRKDADYREKMNVEAADERNRFLRSKAWAWAGYLFIIITAVAVIVLKVLGQELLSMAASYAVCLLLVLYWGAYLILRKKY